jgi:hypothetical protein
VHPVFFGLCRAPGYAEWATVPSLEQAIKSA